MKSCECAAPFGGNKWTTECQTLAIPHSLLLYPPSTIQNGKCFSFIEMISHSQTLSLITMEIKIE